MKENNISYKWKKLFASINHQKGRIELSTVEAQELIDDIESLVLTEKGDWIVKAAKELLSLHAAEEEGLQSGQPTAEQWREAVETLRKLIYK